jgi:hypothetical protein
MPCNCDGYEDRDNSILDTVERLNKELCRARAIIMKMLNNDTKADCSNHPEDLVNKAEHEVALLLKHKKVEILADVKQLMHDLEILRRREKSIRDLGGEPGLVFLRQVKHLETEITALENLTDDEILGT